VRLPHGALLLDHAALATNGPGEAEVSHVRLMTLHKGNGLEFHHVFLPGWESHSLPPPYGDLVGAALGICRAHPGNVAGDDFALRLPARLRGAIAVHW
jgi:hypothetical protein